MAQQRVILTGSTGLLGAHLYQKLAKQYTVCCPVRIKRGEEEVQLDLTASSYDDVLPEKADIVIHLAQSRHFREFPQRAEDIFEVNTLSTLRLCDYARRAGVKTFVLASTGGVYGDLPCDDRHPLLQRKEGLGFYPASKWCSEIIASSYTPFFNVVILRYFFIYGPGQQEEMLIPRLVKTVQEQRSICLEGEEGLAINPIFVDDAALATLHAAQMNHSDTINIAGQEVLSLRTIGEMIGQRVQKEPLFAVKKSEKSPSLVASTDKMNQLLGEARTSFEKGLSLSFKLK